MKIVVAAFSVVLALTAAHMAAAEAPLQIGVISSLDPVGTTWSSSAILGLQLAQREINASGGINGKQLELLFEDDRFDPKKSITAYQKLRARGITIFIGPQFEQTISAVIPLAEQDEVLLITTIASTPVNHSSKNKVIHSIPSDKLAAKCLAQTIVGDERKRVALIMPEESYSQTFAGFMEGFLTGAELLKINYLPESVDFNLLLLRARKFNADALVFFFVTVESAVTAFRKLAQLNWEVPIYSNEVLHESQFLLDNGGAAIFGTKYCGIPFDPDKPGIRKLLAALPAKPALPLYTVAAYDTLRWLAAALRQEPHDLATLRRLIEQQHYEGLLAAYEFDELGDLLFDDFTVYEISKSGFNAK